MALFLSDMCSIVHNCTAFTGEPTWLYCGQTWLYLCLQKGVVDTQLIAHDKAVYDIAWGGVGVFASVSADGSVRVFDLR